MFEYVCNEYNERPALVLDSAARPVGKLVVDLPYSTSLLLPIPASVAELKALHSRKYWSKLRRYERRLDEEGGGLQFRVLTEEGELRGVLPQVQLLFAERWSEEFTSFGWKTAAGFEPYAEAMVRLARAGRGELAVLEDRGRLLSFAYCLLQDRTYYFYQHASTTAEQYRRYSVGKVLLAKLVEDLVRNRRGEVLDLMTGAADYKREWARIERPIYFRIEEERSLAGWARFVLRTCFYRLKFYVQFDNVRLRAAAKRSLLWLDRAAAWWSRWRDHQGQPAGSKVNTRTP